MSEGELTRQLKEEARRLGFDLVGSCPAVTPAGISRFAEWLEAGHAGEMHYLSSRREAYEHPRSVLDGARSLLMLAVNYRTSEPEPPGPGDGRISRYAWGTDYHDVIHDKLKSLARWLTAAAPGCTARGTVDTAPLLEREFAQLAGLGWIGKNTMLLNRDVGSWFFLAALLTDVELDYDDRQESDHCGTCTACLDACPTSAFTEPYILDSRKCISYLTIELRSAIPVPLRPGLNDWVFGCDICQDVCPWNNRAPTTQIESFQPSEAANPLELSALFELSDEQFRTRFRRTPLWRTRRRGLLRNAAIVLGNKTEPAALPSLIRGLNDPEPLIRGACAWALGRYEQTSAREALVDRWDQEPDEDVRSEIDAALQGSEGRDQGAGIRDPPSQG